MNIRTFLYLKQPASAFNLTLWGLQILATLSFIIAGPLKFFVNPLTIKLLANFDAAQWFFYLSGSVGGLQLLKQTREAMSHIFTHHKLCPNLNHINK
jgi:hypothetical protein